jgi:hypothetical protein
LKAGEEVGTPRDEALKDMPAEDAGETTPSPAAPERADETAKAHPPRVDPAATSSSPLRFGPRYELSWLGEGAHFEDGPGAVFALALPVGFELSAFYRRPLQVEDTPVGVRLQTLSARALATHQVWRGERTGLRLGAGAGADLVRVRALGESGQDVELSGATWRNHALARLQASCAWRAFSFMELELTAGADLDANGTRYVFEQGSGASAVLDPSPVRPFVSLGVTVP